MSDSSNSSSEELWHSTSGPRFSKKLLKQPVKILFTSLFSNLAAALRQLYLGLNQLPIRGIVLGIKSKRIVQKRARRLPEDTRIRWGRQRLQDTTLHRLRRYSV